MTSIIGVLCTLLFVFYGSEVFSLIVPEQAAYEAGGIFLRIDGYSMILMMLEITTQGMFYGTGRTVPPAIISISCNTLRIPFSMLERLIAHQTPVIPSPAAASPMAKGMRKVLRVFGGRSAFPAC